ncbi:ABC transporter permease [Paenibacillus oryzisoli]|uniref:ABC transporter permease n=1 Tax=Paenibacillus oryzisoli TaxID=1850517 RepID=UPI003D2AFA39
MSLPSFRAQALWQRRFHYYMKEAIGYWQYAARSNFLGFLLFLVIVSSYYYAKILQRLPTDYPYLWVVLLLLVPFTASSPIRTLTRSADRMFLLRVEHEMGAYFRSAMRYSLSLQAAWQTIALVAVWPLYHHCTGAGSGDFLLMLALLLLFKLANGLASWQESRWVREQARRLSAGLRWAATLGLVAIQFAYGPVWAGLSALALVVLWLGLTRPVHKYWIGWDYLIAREKQQQARLYAFFNWFVDVPQLPTRITRRAWLAGLTTWIPFRQQSSFFYLYMKTLLRTEMFSILLRITAIGVLAVAVSDSLTTGGVIFFITLAVSLMQLSTLERAHRYTFWLEMYPLDPAHKPGSLAFLIWLVQLAQLCLLAIPLLVHAPLKALLVPLAALAFISLACGVFLRRKFKKNALLEA